MRSKTRERFFDADHLTQDRFLTQRIAINLRQEKADLVSARLVKSTHSEKEQIPMPTETNPSNQTTIGADAIDEAIAQGIDFDGSPIPPAKLELYGKVMALEGNRQRSGVSNTMRSRIVRIGAKHISQAELDQLLLDADFAPLKEKEIAFYYGGK